MKKRYFPYGEVDRMFDLFLETGHSEAHSPVGPDAGEELEYGGKSLFRLPIEEIVDICKKTDPLYDVLCTQAEVLLNTETWKVTLEYRFKDTMGCDLRRGVPVWTNVVKFVLKYDIESQIHDVPEVRIVTMYPVIEG